MFVSSPDPKEVSAVSIHQRDPTKVLSVITLQAKRSANIGPCKNAAFARGLIWMGDNASHPAVALRIDLCVAGARVISSCMSVRNCDVCKVAAPVSISTAHTLAVAQGLDLDLDLGLAVRAPCF